MINIQITGLKELQAGLNDLIKHRLPKITAISLTKTASKVVEESQKDMQQIFDRPTPFILKSQWIKAATPQDLTATVEWKSRASKSVSGWNAATRTLNPHTAGGLRVWKNFEKALNKIGVLPHGYYAMPGDAATLDAYGNMSRGQIIQILSYFKAFKEGGYKANITEKRKRKLAIGSRRQMGFAYFVGRPGGGRLPLGIYQRFHSSSKVSVLHSLRPILIFTRTPGYHKRWDVYGNAQKVIDRELPKIFKQVADETLVYWSKK